MKPIGTNKNFVFNGKIKFDFSKNNHLNSTFNKKANYGVKRNENKYIREFRSNFSINEKKKIFEK